MKRWGSLVKIVTVVCAVLFLIVLSQKSYTQDAGQSNSNLNQESGSGVEYVRWNFPSSWVRNLKEKRHYAFVTSQDQNRALIGYIRNFFVEKQTALEWAIDEANSLETKGLLVLSQPSESSMSNGRWATLRWEGNMPLGGQMILSKGQQYFFKNKTTMVEVFLGAPAKIFDNYFPREEIEQFLASVRFEKKTSQNKIELSNGEDLARLAAQYFNSRQFDKAIEVGQMALTKITDKNLKSDILFTLSSAHLEQGIIPFIKNKDDSNYKKSIEYAQECLNITPGHWKALANIATVYMNMGELEKADIYYTEAEKYTDNNSPYYQQLILQHGVVRGVMKARKEQSN